jgi:MFS superfamily sulfate permease-like transporter
MVFLFGIYGRLELAMPLIIIIGMHGLVILFKWKLRRHKWFWIAMTVSAALHVPLILFVPWHTRWVPALALAVIASADFCLILWILLVIERLMGGPKTTER